MVVQLASYRETHADGWNSRCHIGHRLDWYNIVGMDSRKRQEHAFNERDPLSDVHCKVRMAAATGKLNIEAEQLMNIASNNNRAKCNMELYLYDRRRGKEPGPEEQSEEPERPRVRVDRPSTSTAASSAPRQIFYVNGVLADGPPPGFDRNGNQNCDDCENCAGCINCTGCTNCSGCVNCVDCVNCIGCTGLRGARNMMGNMPMVRR